MNREFGVIQALSLLLFAALLASSAHASSESDALGEKLDQIQDPKVAKQLNDLLAWSIEHSDPSELQRKAEEASSEVNDPATLAARRAEVQALIKELGDEPSEKQLMEDALAIAANSSAGVEQRTDALQALRYLVEPIDNAMDLPKLGGLTVLARLLGSDPEPRVRASAQHTLGTAASNNPSFQAEALADGKIVPDLLQNSLSEVGDVSEKALYAISALASSNHEGQRQFYAAGGVNTLRELLEGDTSTRQLRRVLNLVTDLTDVEGQIEGQHLFAERKLLSCLLDLLKHPDHDVHERAILALISLSHQGEAKRLIKLAGGEQAVKEAVVRCDELMVDADEDYRGILKDLVVLYVDLEEILIQDGIPRDREEL